MPATCNGRRNGTLRFPRLLLFSLPSICVSSIRLVVALSVFAVAPLSAADDGDDIAMLVRHGTPELAQRLIEHYQSESGDDSADWARWEKHRIALDFAQEQWETVLSRAAALPAGVDPALRHWAQTRAAEAELTLKRPAAARERLAKLIWAREDSLGVQQLAEWRRLVIETYLADGRKEEANTALQRYRQDAASPEAEDDRLTARVWLAGGRAAEVADLLADKKDPESRSWGLLADLRAQRHSPETVMAQAQALANAAGTPPESQWRLWAIAAEAAQASGDEFGRIEMLEQAVSRDHGDVVDAGLLHADADVLWDAYQHYGTQLAQRAQLVVDDYSPWFEIEQRLHARKPVEARSLMAVLAVRDANHPLAATAHAQLAGSLEESGRGAVLEALYLHSKRIPNPDSVPPAVRYRLAKVALERGDVSVATRLMNGLSAPPADAEMVAWQLSRARALLAAGSVELGIGALESVMHQAKTLTLPQRRAALRAAGVVQTLGRHQVALALLHSLAAATPEMELQRELQFWIGQSYEALGDYQRAALSYLRTTYLAGDAAIKDDWGQRGRYHAAAALALAGLTGDARRLYAGLMGADTEPAQRALAMRALDQLESTR